METTTGLNRENAPTSIAIPNGTNGIAVDPAETPKANGLPPINTGFSISATSPGPSKLQTTTEEAAGETKTQGQAPTSPSVNRANDYFSSPIISKTPETPTEAPKAPVTPGDTPVSPTDAEGEKKKGLFGKKFQMGFPKKLGRTSVEVKQTPVEAQLEESDKSTEAEEKTYEDNLFGVVQKIRNDYDELLAHNPGQGLAGGITPSLPSETPVLKLPAHTQIMIQEDSPESGGVIDLYRGTLSTQTQETDLIEKVAPVWLGELLLRVSMQPLDPSSHANPLHQNSIQFKEPAKVSFILQPYQETLPSIASLDGSVFPSLLKHSPPPLLTFHPVTPV